MKKNEETGSIVIKYKYDPYGKVEVEGSLKDIYYKLNRIIYKGYYYDEETKFYYLKNRYYSPIWGRFISPDDVDYLETDSAKGLNLYVYCMGDPINYVDPDGDSAILVMILIGTLFGAATGFVFDAGKQLMNNNWNFSEVDWGRAVNSAIVVEHLDFL